MDTESIDKGISQGGRHWPGRVDWRSGEMANLRDDAFWHRLPALRELRASKRASHDTTNVDVLVMLCFGALPHDGSSEHVSTDDHSR